MDLAEQIKQSFFNILPYEQRPNAISISSLPFCLRRPFFNLKFNANPLPNARMIRGKIMHYVLSEMQMFKGCVFEDEVIDVLKNSYLLIGHVDVWDEINGLVYEFKFTSRVDSGELDGFYFAQANAYAVLKSASGFYLVKVNPNTFDVRVLEGTPDESAYQALKQRALLLIDCLESNTIPDGPERDWECKNCVYNIVCSNLKDEQRRLR